jgi:hypothetical protein
MLLGNSARRGKRATLEDARGQLSAVWFIGSGVVFFILLTQSLFGKYGADTQQVWAWYVPCVVPTLSLMVSVLGAGALGTPERRYLRTFFHELTWWLSIGYISVLGLTVLAASLRDPAVDTLVLSSAWLGPLQGIVVAAIGYIFISKHALEEGNKASPPSDSNRVGSDP